MTNEQQPADQCVKCGDTGLIWPSNSADNPARCACNPADQGRGVGESDVELIEELLTQAQAHFNVDCCNDSYPIASTNRLLETAAKRIGELAAIAALTHPKGDALEIDDVD